MKKDRKIYKYYSPSDSSLNSNVSLDFSCLFDVLPGLYIILSPGLRVIEVNEAYCAATFKSRNQLLGKYLFDVFPEKPDDKSTEAVSRVRKTLLLALNNKRPYSVGVVRYDLQTSEGIVAELYWSAISKPVLNSEGEVTHLIHKVEDVTDFIMLQKYQMRQGVQTNELRARTRQMEMEIVKRSNEIELLNDELAEKVAERTRELENINKDLADYKFALDASSIIVITDANGIILHVNDNFSKISKYSREEMIGRDHRLLNSGYHSKEFMREMWQTISSGNIWRGEFKNKAKDGTLYWVDTTIVPFLGENGVPVKYLAIRSDTTERVLYRDSLKASEENYRSLYENTIVAIVTIDLRSVRPLTVNDTAARLFGYQSKEDFLTYFDPGFHFESCNGSISHTFFDVDEEESAERVQLMKRLDGSAFWAKVFVKQNASKDLAQCVIIDISQQIEASAKLEAKVKELEELNKELESFNYISSHDLQEPLRKIRNFVSVLLQSEQANLSADGRYYLERMSSTSSQMQMLIEDLLAYARVKKAPRNFEREDLNEIISEVLNEFRDDLAGTGTVIISDGHCKTRVIKFQFIQLLRNFLSNSNKFRHPGKTLRIRISSEISLGKDLHAHLDAEVKYCHLLYSDNGIGFDPQYSERIFEIFERLNPSELYPGTGVGLAICKRIVENHNGVITATGAAGKGAAFNVYWPV